MMVELLKITTFYDHVHQETCRKRNVVRSIRHIDDFQGTAHFKVTSG